VCIAKKKMHFTVHYRKNGKTFSMVEKLIFFTNNNDELVFAILWINKKLCNFSITHSNLLKFLAKLFGENWKRKFSFVLPHFPMHNQHY
jgi:sulfatase maturation enzyme AslB (radical SAM superfamily)